MKIHVRHILVKQKFEAEDIQKKLQAGSKFEELAKKFSTCGSAANGGDLGAVDSRRFVPEFAEAAEQLKAGETSGIVRTQFGYHIIFRIA